MKQVTQIFLERESPTFSTFFTKQLKSSHERCSIKTGVLRNFTKFTGKHLCQSLFLIKLQATGTDVLQ